LKNLFDLKAAIKDDFELKELFKVFVKAYDLPIGVWKNSSSTLRNECEEVDDDEILADLFNTAISMKNLSA
jgi:hypothetical protein